MCTSVDMCGGECVLLPVSSTRNFASALAVTLRLPMFASPANCELLAGVCHVLIIFAPSVSTEQFLLNHTIRRKAWDKTLRESSCFSGPGSVSHVSPSL